MMKRGVETGTPYRDQRRLCSSNIDRGTYIYMYIYSFFNISDRSTIK